MVQSFVNKDILVRYDDYKTFMKYVSDKRANNDFLLENIDVSDIEVIANIDFSGFTIRNSVFGSFNPARDSKHRLFNLNFKNAVMDCVSFVQCDIVQCNFDHVKGGSSCLHKVDFFYSDFVSCRFRYTLMDIADFRYTHISDCSMSGVRVHLGDFYMASFSGTTNFKDSAFNSCSFTHASFDFHCIEMSNIPGGLVQENFEDYKIMVESSYWIKYNPCGDKSKLNDSQDILEQEAYIYKEASCMYSSLSGIYGGKGLYNDSNKAYKKCKQNLKRYYLLKFVIDAKSCSYGKMFEDLVELIKYFFTWLLGFGYEWGRVALLFFLLVLVYAVIFLIKSAEGCFSDAFAYSLNNSLGPYDKFIAIVSNFTGSFQTTIGILLLGFIGFIFANKIRNNS